MSWSAARKKQAFASVVLVGLAVAVQAKADDRRIIADLAPIKDLSPPKAMSPVLPSPKETAEPVPGRLVLVPESRNGWSDGGPGAAFFVTPKKNSLNAEMPNPSLELLESARRGDPEAQYQIGRMYYRGVGFPQNFSEAAMWFKRSAEQGHVDSQGQLGRMYMRDEGVPRDQMLAYKWLALAAASGDQTWINDRQRAAGSLKPPALAQAQEMVRDWSPFAADVKQASADLR